jgi:hypothetical protein
LLILLQTLQVPVQINKEKDKPLPKERQKQLTDMAARAKELLELTPGGKKFANVVISILERENNWVCNSLRRL